MRITPSACLLFLALATVASSDSGLAYAKYSSAAGRPRASRPPTGSSPSKKKKKAAKKAPASRRRYEDDDEEEEEEEFDDFEYPDEFEDVEEEAPRKKNRSSSSRKPPMKSRKPPPRHRYEEDEEDDYYERPSPRRSSSGGRTRSRGPPSRSRRYDDYDDRPRGRVVPYTNQRPSTFSRGLAAIRDNMPDPSTVRNAALSSISAARQTTSRLSANLYREVKGLTSSELEQVMLKATRPDDTPVKGKHVERLVGVTYQISGRYDIYDAVLRKLWAKMTEKDWRTKMKALYILHRFSSDGAPEHQAALKARLRELRRTRDPKRKDKYFNSKQLLAGDSTPENVAFRAFLSRYAHYVLLRAQCFSGSFDEIGKEPVPSKSSSRKKAVKPLTSTMLRSESLEAAIMVLKAGTSCALKDGEVCEHTAVAVERVASDLMALSKAVAIALNKALTTSTTAAAAGGGEDGCDPVLLKKWCTFYSESLYPQTRSMMKKTSPKLDAYGLFLPSRIGTTVSQELLQKGLKGPDTEKKVDEEERELAVEVEEKTAAAAAAAKDAEAEEDTAEKEAEGDDDEEEGDEEEDEEGDEEMEEDAVEEDEEEEEEEDDEDFEYDEEYYDDE